MAFLTDTQICRTPRNRTRSFFPGLRSHDLNVYYSRRERHGAVSYICALARPDPLRCRRLRLPSRSEKYANLGPFDNNSPPTAALAVTDPDPPDGVGRPKGARLQARSEKRPQQLWVHTPIPFTIHCCCTNRHRPIPRTVCLQRLFSCLRQSPVRGIGFFTARVQCTILR